jgi:hypothetical protein
MRKNKLLLLLALLMTAATGAWADETPLLTIESKDYKDFKSGSMTFDDKVTVTFSDEVENDGDSDGWYRSGAASLLTVAGINGYTITSCKFYTKNGTASTGYTVEGESPSVYLSGGFVYTDDSKSVFLGSPGINKIEVYGGVASAGYTVSLKGGVKDADKWTISPNPAEEGQTVTLQYNGRLKVKGVKATSDAAAAAVPDGAINGVFSVSDSKQVYFSKGNLRYASSKWSFFDNQYDFYTSYSADAWDKFGWSTSATDYGMNTSTSNGDYSGDFVDWGATMGAGWRTLTSDEWAYLLKTRSASTVNGTENGRYAKAKVNDVGGVILFPDTYTHPDGVAAPTGVNATDEYGWEGNSYTAADWTKMESAGCVFLPAAGCRYGSEMIGLGSYGYYGSATPDGADYAYRVKFNSGSLEPANSINRCLGCSVRLVQEATSEAEQSAKPAAAVTTAPTGAAIVGRLNTNSTALVSGGVADGGTLMYAVTTTNTKPTSTAGFSDAVPTAKDITASGKVYVWYYVKADDSHSDSEIAATAIEVPVADIVWDATNVSDLNLHGTDESYTKEGVTLSCNANQISAAWYNYGDPTKDGISFNTRETGGFTFTAPTGKAFAKIEMKANGPGGWSNANLGTGWSFNNTTVTWTGSASTVDLLTGANKFNKGTYISYIAFYLSE